MKISVITASYNSSETISDTIDSINSQDYENWSHVILDGASTDDTVAVCSSHASPKRFLHSDPDSGIYDAMNKGIELVDGEIIGFLNADDFYESDSVLSCIAKAFESPDIDIVYGNLFYVDYWNTKRIIRNWRSETYAEGMFRRGWMPPHPTVYVRKDFLKKVGNFDLSFPICADWEWLYRAFCVHRASSIFLDVPMVRMRVGGVSNSSIRNVIASNQQAVRAFAKHGEKLPIQFFPGKLLHRLTQFLRI